MSTNFKCPHCGSGPDTLTCLMRGVTHECAVDWYEDGVPTPGDDIDVYYDTAVVTYLCRNCGIELTADQIMVVVSRKDEDETNTKEN